MDKEKINYFTYIRKSTESDGRQVLSIPAQIEEATKLQEREHLNVVDTIISSASAMIPYNRPEYSEMIKRIKKGGASGIIVWKVDRLARNHVEWGELMYLLQIGVIKSIWTPHREYQSRDSALLIALEASMATQYSVDLSDNVKRGLRKKIELGQPPLIARLGYLNTKFSEHGTNAIVVDKKRWVHMRKAFDLMLTRQYSIAQIVEILNNEFNFRTRPSKKRSGRPLAISILHRAFTDPFYTGYFNYMGKLHKGTYKPMITLEEFDAIQDILGRKGKSKPIKHQFAFTGLMTCGSCGSAITASRKLKILRSTGEYKTYTFYHCTKKKRAIPCKLKSSTAERILVSLIEKELETIELIPEMKSWAVETIKEDYDDELMKHKKLLKSTQDYEQKLRLELDTLLDLRISQELTDQQYTQKKAEREALLIRVREKCKNIESNINAWIDQVTEKLDFAVTASELFKNDDFQLRKRICNYFGSNWILEGKKVTFTRPGWVFDIEKLKIHYGPEFEGLEPRKTFMEYRKTEAFQVSKRILCGLRDNVANRHRV